MELETLDNESDVEAALEAASHFYQLYVGAEDESASGVVTTETIEQDVAGEAG